VVWWSGGAVEGRWIGKVGRTLLLTCALAGMGEGVRRDEQSKLRTGATVVLGSADYIRPSQGRELACRGRLVGRE
jgi:hypothetical protein